MCKRSNRVEPATKKQSSSGPRVGRNLHCVWESKKGENTAEWPRWADRRGSPPHTEASLLLNRQKELHCVLLFLYQRNDLRYPIKCLQVAVQLCLHRFTPALFPSGQNISCESKWVNLDADLCEGTVFAGRERLNTAPLWLLFSAATLNHAEANPQKRQQQLIL